jgi:hypothetical protein
MTARMDHGWCVAGRPRVGAAGGLPCAAGADDAESLTARSKLDLVANINVGVEGVG